MTEGFFITIEGIDGAGTTTAAELIAKELENTELTQEPSPTWTGPVVRRAFEEENAPAMTDFHLFLADRANHIEKVLQPALEEGKTVISDRYADSTRAYQAIALQGVVEEPVDYIEYSMGTWQLTPDLTLLIDIDVDTAMQRNDGEDKFEKRQFQEQVRKNYLAINEATDRMVKIDGSQSKEQVAQTCLAEIKRRM